LLKDRSWYSKFRSVDLDEVGSWWITFDGPAHLALAQKKFRFHTGGATSPQWRQAAQMSDFFVLQALLSREMVRLGRLLRRNYCTRAAECLATALYAGRLRRRWRWRDPISIFAPDDSAMAVHPETAFDRLLAPGREKELVDFVFAHMVPEKLALIRPATATSAAPITPAGAVTAGNDRSLSIEWTSRGATIGGCRILARHELPLDNVLYIVDGVLPSANFNS
jgi:fasciclin domain-containing protein